MGKIEKRLTEQTQMNEYAQEAEDCLKIYNALKSMFEGFVWRSHWDVLIKVRIKRESTGIVCTYYPSKIGRVFLKGLETSQP